MMNLEQFLLTKLAEECVEVAQRALKAQQFGMLEKQPGQDKTNSERLEEEFTDLIVVWSLVNDVSGLDFLPDPNKMGAKMAKIDKYLKYSQDLGLVER